MPGTQTTPFTVYKVLAGHSAHKTWVGTRKTLYGAQQLGLRNASWGVNCEIYLSGKLVSFVSYN